MATWVEAIAASSLSGWASACAGWACEPGGGSRTGVLDGLNARRRVARSSGQRDRGASRRRMAFVLAAGRRRATGLATKRSSGSGPICSAAHERVRPEGEASSGMPVTGRGGFETVWSDRPAWPCLTYSGTNDAMEILAQLCAEHGVSWPCWACGRISGSHYRSCGCGLSRPSRDCRRRIATMLSGPIPLRAWWGRYRGCAWGDARDELGPRGSE